MPTVDLRPRPLKLLPPKMFRWNRRPTTPLTDGPSQAGEGALDATLLDAVRALRRGGAPDDCFGRINRAVRGRLAAYFQSHGARGLDADELVQTTLEKVYLGVKGLDNEERFLGWLFTIARNVRLSAVDRVRRERSRCAGGLELAENMPDPRRGDGRPGDENSLLANEERLQEIRGAIDGPPPQQKRCLLLRVREEMSYDEIAATHVLSVHTVRNHLAAARKGLRETLGVEEFDL